MGWDDYGPGHDPGESREGSPECLPAVFQSTSSSQFPPLWAEQLILKKCSQVTMDSKINVQDTEEWRR